MNDDKAPPTQYPKVKQYVPSTDTEYMSSITRPGWGDRSLMPGLDAQVSDDMYIVNDKGELLRDKNGHPVRVGKSLLQLYEMFTQDLRLGNLNSEEVDFCREHLDLAHDLMQAGYPGSALIVFERAIDVIETSHSKGGWFREGLGRVTTRQEQTYEEKKPGFFKGSNNGR